MPQKKRRRWPLFLLAFFVTLGLAAAAGVHYAPSYVKRYVEENYPGVTVDSVHLELWERRATFNGVHVERENLKASLDVIEIDRDKNIVVHGGDVDITIVESKGESSGPSAIIADGLHVTVRRDDLVASLDDVSVNALEVCFKSGTAEHPKGTAAFTHGCVQRNKTYAKVSQVTIPVTLPFKIPEVEREQTIVVNDLEVFPLRKVAKVNKLAVGSVATLGPTMVTLLDDSVAVETPSVEVKHSWVGRDPVTFEKVMVLYPLKPGPKSPIELRLGKAILRIDPVTPAVFGSMACATWLDALPKPLPEAMQDMASNLYGQLTIDVSMNPPRFELLQNCSFSCKAKPITDIKDKPRFSYEAYNSKNQLVSRETGPGTNGWTRVLDLPPFVPEAFILLEDPGFNKHRGVLAKALENSLKVNLDKGGFLKGGSTITMQVAKNLWLQRHKTLARKAQEALLTFALESCFRKDQILEMYINIIEFGPDLYGIGPASKHYFKKPPSSLAPDEAFFLASILPAPKKALPPASGGLDRARKIMKALAKSGFLSDAFVDDGAPIDTSSWDAAEN